jgi:putative ABC transport system permease protein
VTIALVLLVSSGLLLRSLDRLFAVDAGFDPGDVLTLQVLTVGPRFADDAATRQFFDDVLAAAMGVRGVREAALTSQLPISGDVDLYGVHFDPAPAADPGEVRGTFRYAVSPSYLQAMRIPVRAGRLFDELDREGAPLVAVVSESLARRRLPGLDPIGRRLRIGAAGSPLFTVVGVVGDVRQLSLAVTDAEAVYVPMSQWHFADRAMSLVVRAREGAGALAPAVREAVRSVDRHQPIARVATFRELLDRSAAERRFALLIVETFALGALLLATAGIYGVLSASVGERVREIAVRSALGASRVGILALVVRQGLLLTALGLGLGLLGASAAAHAIAAMLFAVSPLDPLTYIGVIVTMVAAALLACIVPAWRAARIDPARTLGVQ